jgi:ABC-2 type transport system ATP-binding protein
MFMNMVEVENLSTGYGRDIVLREVTLAVPPGELLVVLGARGAGKSTLLKAMVGLLPPRAGAVRLFGTRPSREVRSRVGAVIDEPAHWDKLTGWENAYFFARSYGVPEREVDQRLEELFRWSGLWGRRSERAGTYSYGARRKLSIIEAFVHRPNLLLLDRPSTGLDRISALSLYRALKEMTARGRSVVVATDDEQEASILADRVCVLDGGRVVAVARPEEIVPPMDIEARVRVTLTAPVDLSLLSGIQGVEAAEVDAGDRRRAIFSVRRGGERPEGEVVRILEHLSRSGAAVREVKMEPPDGGQVTAILGGRERNGPP